MRDPYHLQRFLDAQKSAFETAVLELKSGSKRSHWMWFIFPQLAGLGRSELAQFYGLTSVSEARAYLDHPLLGPRLHQCIEALLSWRALRSAEQILGPVDAIKLRSSLTLFELAGAGCLCKDGLDAFFDGQRDERTLALLKPQA